MEGWKDSGWWGSWGTQADARSGEVIEGIQYRAGEEANGVAE